jgi:hypothetical protein
MPALLVSKRLDLNTPLLTRGLLHRSYCPEFFALLASVDFTSC